MAEQAYGPNPGGQQRSNMGAAAPESYLRVPQVDGAGMTLGQSRVDQAVSAIIAKRRELVQSGVSGPQLQEEMKKFKQSLRQELGLTQEDIPQIRKKLQEFVQSRRGVGQGRFGEGYSGQSSQSGSVGDGATGAGVGTNSNPERVEQAAAAIVAKRQELLQAGLSREQVKEEMSKFRQSLRQQLGLTKEDIPLIRQKVQEASRGNSGRGVPSES